MKQLLLLGLACLVMALGPLQMVHSVSPHALRKQYMDVRSQARQQQQQQQEPVLLEQQTERVWQMAEIREEAGQTQTQTQTQTETPSDNSANEKVISPEATESDGKVHPSSISAVHHKSKNTHIYLINNNNLVEDKPATNFGAEFDRQNEERLKDSEKKLKEQAQEYKQKEKQEEETKQKIKDLEEGQKKESIQKSQNEAQQKQQPCFDSTKKLVPKATEVQVNVDAKINSLRGRGFPAESGIYLKRGTPVEIIASGVWYAAGDSYMSDANGLSQLPAFNTEGLSTSYGTLVGRIGDGPWFKIGTNFYSCSVEGEGRLRMVYWDSDSDNNRGTIPVKIRYQRDTEKESSACFAKQVASASARQVNVNAMSNSVSQNGVPLKTGAWIKRGTSLKITAAGTWYASTDDGLMADANGWANIWNGLRIFSLVGRIGNGNWFFIGANFFACEVAHEGPLELAYWDSDSANNRGSVSVVITYQRDAQQESICENKQVPNAVARSMSVAAKENSVNGGTPLNSGVTVQVGKPLRITASGVWYAAYNGALRSDPNGYPNLYQFQGLNGRLFSLVGRIGDGPWFQVGSDFFDCYPRQGGVLQFVYWDTNNGDNSGSVNVNVVH